MKILSNDKPLQSSIKILKGKNLWGCEERSNIILEITNLTNNNWSNFLPIHLSYHWYHQDGSTYQWDGIRTKIGALAAQETKKLSATIIAPSEKGEYFLELQIVHEGVGWLTNDTPKILASITPEGSNIFNSRLQRIQEFSKINKDYRSWSDYLNWSCLNRILLAPETENDQAILRSFQSHLNFFRKKATEDAPQCKVSVIMPVYNRATEVGEAIESVLNQSYAHWELIIVDDASTDETLARISTYQDSRIKLFAHQTNQGQSIARNLALEQSSGEYIAYLDSDNSWHPDYLLIMVNELSKANGFSAAYSAQLCREIYPEQDVEYLRYGPFNLSLLENQNYLDLNAYIHHRSLYEKYGGFNPLAQTCEDWHLILKYTQDSLPLAIPAILSFYNFDSSIPHVFDNKSDLDTTKLVNEIIAKEKIDLLEFPQSDKLDRDLTQQFYHQDTKCSSSSARSISVIIPSFEIPEYLNLCLQSLIKYSSENLKEIIIVDNASSEKTKTLLNHYSNLEKIRIQFLPSNQGFSAAINHGIKIADPKNDLIFLNNDTLVTRNWLESMQDCIERYPDTGMIIPRQVLPANTKTINVHQPYANSKREIDVNLSVHHQNLINSEFDPLLGLMELNFAPFFCVYLRREVIELIGVLDQEVGPHYFSDKLYCELLRTKTKYKIIYTPHSKVYHFLQKATSQLELSNPEKHQALFNDGISKVTHTDGINNQSPDSIPQRITPSELSPLKEDQLALINSYTKLFCELWDNDSVNTRHTLNSWWCGHLAQKIPNDLWIYQEIIYETQPDLIIETGTNRAGSTLFLAHICDLLGRGEIVSVDIVQQPGRPKHSRIKYLHGSSTDSEILRQIKALAQGKRRIMVILDSDHSQQHVIRELFAYAELVTAGCYLIVEDSVVNGHPYWQEFGPGPMEAIQDFLNVHQDFEIDSSRERYLCTLNPRGFLQKKNKWREFEIPSIPNRSLISSEIENFQKRLLLLDDLETEQGTEYFNHSFDDISQKIELRENGLDWPGQAYTMIGGKRLKQFSAAVQEVLNKTVPGDIIETGVWRGGACMMAKAIFRLAEIQDRSVWLADSFAGLPKPVPDLFPADTGDTHHQHEELAVSEYQVRENFKTFDLLDSQVKFLTGWFSNTLETTAISQIAVLRLDGDMYESTIVALEALYSKLMPGGYLIVDDYGAVPSCAQAIQDFRNKYQIKDPIYQIDWTGVYWKKSGSFSPDEIQLIKNHDQSIVDDSEWDEWTEDPTPELSSLLEQAQTAANSNQIEIAKSIIEETLRIDHNFLPSHCLLAKIHFPDQDYYQVLENIHAYLSPKTYLEIGVFHGNSLSLSKAPKNIAVDPKSRISPDKLQIPDLELYKMTSNQFFQLGYADYALKANGFDLAFIDGAHHFAQVLIDFICLERFATRNSKIILHDTLPIHPSIASPERRTTFYTGDVWKILLILKEYRPELEIETIPCYPSGLTIISGLNKHSKILWEEFSSIKNNFDAYEL